MTAEAPLTIHVLGEGLAEDRIREALPRRSVLGRWRERGSRPPGPAQVERTLYWPIALIHATAQGAGRRHWTERVQGAVDLVSGRVGLVDLELPVPRLDVAPEGDCIPPRVPRGVAELRWHEFFRDHVDRRHKPLRPPTITVDRIHQVWLPSHLVSVGRHRYVIDAVTGRVDELADFPYVANLLAEREANLTEGEEICRA